MISLTRPLGGLSVAGGLVVSLLATSCDLVHETTVERETRDTSTTACALPSNGLGLWLRADDLGLSDGAAVASWADASGQGSHATQGTAGRRPVFQAAAVAGHGAVRFDGIDDR